MDLSKLPKMSQTQVPETNPLPIEMPPPPALQPLPRHPVNIGGEIWISLIVGLLLIYMGGTFARFAIATLAHQQFHTGVNWTDGPKTGTEVSYFELEGFTAWSDMGIFLFGLTLLFEAAAKALIAIKPGAFSRAVLMLAILLTLLAVALNLICCQKLLSVQITPILSGLAVAFGGWILFDEWATLRRVGP